MYLLEEGEKSSRLAWDKLRNKEYGVLSLTTNPDPDRYSITIELLSSVLCCFVDS